MLGVKYVPIPSSGLTMVMTSHQPDLLASSCRKSRLESKCSWLSWYCRALKEIDNLRMRELWSGVIVSQSISWCQPRGLVTWGDTGGRARATLIRPGGPTSRSRHRVIKRWDGLIWTNRGRHRDLAVYCVLTSILLTRHYLSLTQTPGTPEMPSRRFHWFTF